MIIATQHPEITDELQVAINTLRKLQRITGTPVPEAVLNATTAASEDSAALATYVPGSVVGNIDGNIDETFVKVDDKELRFDTKTPILKAGDCFGRYQIVRMLGRGAMGAVFLAYDAQLDRHIALKTPSLDNADTIKRFYREARAAAKIRSPNICPIYDVDQINGIHYLSMSYIEGQSLSDYSRDGKLTSTNEIIETIQKIARGLQKAHDEGIIHRDLKPDNVMIDLDSEPIVMDFGLARKVNDDEAGITKVGTLIGTPAYMSPEQALGDQSKIDQLTDIYSLGVILYQMLTGQLPFRGSVLEVVAKVTSEEPPKPSSISPDVQENSCVEKICLKMMAKSRDERFAKMFDAADALGKCVTGQGQAAGNTSIWKKMRRIFSPSSPA